MSSAALKFGGELPVWARHIEAALQKGAATVRFFSFATVETPLDGSAPLPRVRTVAFRGWHGHSGAFYFVTDGRHSKVEQLETSPRFEVCWYLYEERQQFRIAGAARLVSGTFRAKTDDQKALLKLRSETWKQISTGTQRQYSYPAPGQPLDAKAMGAVERLTPPAEPPETFTLVLLEPDSVDHLTLSEPMMRIRHRRPPDNTGWLPPAPLNP